MKIFVTGTRGIPNIPGGVEKHCQELYPLISSMGHDVILATRTPYVKNRLEDWQCVQLCHTYAPHWKSLEAIVHTFLSVLKAWYLKVDIVHIHAIGPGLIVPFARLLGLKVVVTNHGPDYNRGKWGNFAKSILRLGEFIGGKFANEVIVISPVISDIIKFRCDRSSHLIYNGVPIPVKSQNKDFLDQYGIIAANYILAVARFVPEKGLHDLLEAFQMVDGDFQLVIAGDADHETQYSKKLKKLAKKDKRVVLTGYITGDKLNQVFSNARLFCLPSYHEGLPIALLEAMSYDLPILVSDIPANLEVDLPPDRFYKCGDVSDLRASLKRLLFQELSNSEQTLYQNQLDYKYNWGIIAEHTITVYEKALTG